jgi:hypothetical protein
MCGITGRSFAARSVGHEASLACSALAWAAAAHFDRHIMMHVVESALFGNHVAVRPPRIGETHDSTRSLHCRIASALFLLASRPDSSVDLPHSSVGPKNTVYLNVALILGNRRGSRVKKKVPAETTKTPQRRT